MKSCLFFVLLIFAYSCSQKNKDDITIDFEVQNMTYSRIAVVVGPEAIREVNLDKQGKASCTLQGNVVYARLVYGEEFRDVFFQKGDRVKISFDAGHFKDGMKFEGKNAPVVEYLNSVAYTPITPPEYERPLDGMVRLADEKAEEAIALLKARKLETTNPEFVKWEEGRIKYLYRSSLLMYPVGHVLFDTAYRPGEEYYSVLEQHVQEEESLIDLDVYREFMMESALILASGGKNISGIYNKDVARMKYIARHFKNDRLKQSLLHEIALRYIKENGMDDIAEMENIYNTYVTDPALRAAYKAECDKRNLAVAGKTFSGC